jgi:predicted P-loop ATPase
VVCGRIDVDGLAGVRDQLWAEAKVRFESGCPWWLDTPDLVQLASDQQDARYEGGDWAVAGEQTKHRNIGDPREMP